MHSVLMTVPVDIEKRYTTGLHKIANIKPPLGLLYLSSFLAKSGNEVAVIDSEAQGLSIDDAVDKLIELKPAVIGIQSLTMGYPNLRALTRKIKSNIKNCKIVVGGPHASMYPTDIIKEEPSIDVVVIGEGEHTLRELLLAFHNDSKLEEVRGICFRSQGEARLTSPRAQEPNLDVFPLPAWKKTELDRYDWSPQWERRKPIAPMITSRGCPFHCSFCSKAVFGSRVRRRSPQNVVEEMINLRDMHGVRDIAFSDDTFTLHPKWVDEFCDLVLECKVGLGWSCYSRVDTASQQMFYKMKAAGCWNVFFGVESGSQRLLDNIQKGIKLDQVRKAVAWAKNAKIQVQTSFMLALPGETPELAQKTIDFAIELDPDFAKFNLTSPFPGTKLYEQAQSAGTLLDDHEIYTTQHPVFIPHGYKDADELIMMKKRAFRAFYLRPKFIMQSILAISSLDDIKRYYKGLKGFMAVIKGA